LLDFAEKVDETHLKGFKAFTVNEEFFVGHFPSHPIVPGVLHVEAIRQLCLAFAPGEVSDWRVMQVERVKFRRQILPGDRMTIEAEKLESEEGTLKYKAACITASGKCSEATITLGANAGFAGFTAVPETVADFDRTDAISMDTDKVMSLMPHRFPFLLIDYIAKTEETKVHAIKNISGNEQFFSCGFDNLPEALLCEIGAQASCASILSRPENAGKLGFFMSIDSAESLVPVVPGDQLVIECDLPPSKSRFGKGSCRMTVEGVEVFKSAIMFAIVDA
jgi:3-hydroxymyristoyl/3-hydroxydecanoyl-(acyl carrier protein) dehydratase